MRTVKFINSEAEEALKKYNEHYNECSICQQSPSAAENEATCHEAEYLYENYECLRSEADYAEQIFKAELEERSQNDGNCIKPDDIKSVCPDCCGAGRIKIFEWRTKKCQKCDGTGQTVL